MTSRPLETIPGNLRDGYKQLQPGSMQHVDQLTTERRTNIELRNQSFYTADGQLYTTQKRKSLWAITRLPQNLVLQHIDDAYESLRTDGNYFPPADEAKASFQHKDTVVIDMNGLKLQKDNDEYGHFVLDPKKVKKLNSEQKKAAVRLFGPDEESFGLNMEMLAGAKKLPFVFALMPEYVQHTLENFAKLVVP